MARKLTLLLTLIQIAAAQSTCGSLITYRQFSVLLSSAPSCFQNGCGNPPPAASMSSTCSVNQSCSHLWDFLRKQWQANQCTPDCSGDVACRIPGWPVLNMTSTCTTVPQEWLFSNNGACCTSDTEPFALADWIGNLCNGSEWRQPFAYYGGMAKEDWEEWIAPWNWTVQPDHLNNDNNTNLENCPAAEQILTTFAIENIVTAGEIVLSVGVFWAAAALRKSRHFILLFGLPGIKSWKSALLYGFWYPLAHWLVSSFWTAALIRAEPGYEQVPVGFLGLLLCSRPNSLMVVTCILLWLNRLIPHQFDDQLASVLAGAGDAEQYGRQYSKRLISILGLWVSVSEILVQGLGAYSVFKTTDQGVKKGFYIAGRLIPFWRGNDAMIMYAGALVHTTLSFLTAICLYLSAYCHVREARFQERVFYALHLFWIPELLNRHFRHDQQQAQQRQEQQQQQQQQQQGGQDQGSTGQLVPTGHGQGQNSPSDRQGQGQTQTHPDPSSSEKAQQGELGENGDDTIMAIEATSTTITTITTPSHHHIFIDRFILRIYVRLVGPSPPPDVRDEYPALQRAIDEARSVLGEDLTPEWAVPILILTTWFAGVNYIAQWLFWAGFVRMQGVRYVLSLFLPSLPYSPSVCLFFFFSFFPFFSPSLPSTKRRNIEYWTNIPCVS